MPFTLKDQELMIAVAQETADEAQALVEERNEGIQFQDDGADVSGKGAIGTVNFIGFNVSSPSAGVLNVEDTGGGGGASARQMKQRMWF